MNLFYLKMWWCKILKIFVIYKLYNTTVLNKMHNAVELQITIYINICIVSFYLKRWNKSKIAEYSEIILSLTVGTFWIIFKNLNSIFNFHIAFEGLNYSQFKFNSFRYVHIVAVWSHIDKFVIFDFHTFTNKHPERLKTFTR